MKKYTRFKGDECFLLNGEPTDDTVLGFWSWAYSELNSNMVRSVLAEYIVAHALGITDTTGEEYRIMWRPYDLLYRGKRIEVKCASTVQTWNTKHKGQFKFSIAPARIPDEDGDYKDDAPVQRNSDFYIFCIFAPDDEAISPLHLDEWRFLVLPTKVLDEMSPTQKTISIKPLIALNPIEAVYEELKRVLDDLIDADASSVL